MIDFVRRHPLWAGLLSLFVLALITSLPLPIFGQPAPAPAPAPTGLLDLLGLL